MPAHLRQDVFKFLRELKRNNTREWFQKNKDRYEEQVKQTMLDFIADIAADFKKVNPSIRVDPKPSGGSLFRIYRDIRFSADKSPYKTHLGAHFPHKSSQKKVHTPGFYLHIEPKKSFVASGIWHPDNQVLAAIRTKIVKDPKAWQKLTGKLPPLGGDSLKKAPKGFDANHPYVEDLKRKDYICSIELSDEDVCSTRFKQKFLTACKKMNPLVEYLSKVR